MEKPIAVFLQAGAAFMLVAAGMIGGDVLLLIAPGIVSGAAGLLLWGRATQREGSSSAVAAPPSDPQLNQMQDALVALQDDVARIRDDRDFMRNLYSGSSVPARPATQQ